LLRDGHGKTPLSAPGGQNCTKTGTDFYRCIINAGRRKSKALGRRVKYLHPTEKKGAKAYWFVRNAVEEFYVVWYYGEKADLSIREG
jgi:hypothetical protein